MTMKEKKENNQSGVLPVPRHCILCRYSEIALKGRNRFLFEDALVSNIRACLKRNNIDGSIRKIRGRIIVYIGHAGHEKSVSFLRKVFGLSSLSPAFEIPSDMDLISSFSLDYASKNTAKKTRTFRVSANRPNKRFPVNSNDINIRLGDLISEKFNFSVSLKQPDFDLNVEIHETTFIHHEKVPCLGGLPVGITGNVCCLVEEPLDILSPFLLMKRGCSITLLSTKNFDFSLLKHYDYGSGIVFHRLKTDKDINGFISRLQCGALAVPDTLESFNPSRYAAVDSAVLTPLIAYTPEQLEELYEVVSDV